ncbi:unnamed protein product [Menidia menidia]|uniref:(Atlantic silverside) hypothetical protein n=1 Tax=Menidia menidia TaxID=238744 RepID=A0A8S4BA33_9TELE|nr:unnamed protein product [Menidia menidia]
MLPEKQEFSTVRSGLLNALCLLDFLLHCLKQFICVGFSFVFLNNLVDCIQKLLNLELIAPVFIPLVVLPVFIIKNVAPATTSPDQGPQLFTLINKLLDLYSFIQLVTCSYDCLLLFCEFIYSEHNEKNMRTGSTFCDAPHHLSLHLLLWPPRVIESRSVNKDYLFPINTSHHFLTYTSSRFRTIVGGTNGLSE